jgi:putative glutamine amidotransferase
MTVVGLPLRIFSGPSFPTKVALNRTYFDALEGAGADVLPIPVVRDVTRLRLHYEMLDALLLPGGADVEPQRYGAVPRSDAGLYLMPEIDDVELNLLGWALADGMPVLAICRGIQVLNVALGGTLWQDLRAEGVTQRPHDCEPRDSQVHDLEVERESVLARTLGATRIRVNSLHHQAIRDLAPGLRAVGHTEDGLIEGVELGDGRFVVGIQCHPEELVRKEEWARRLFEGLVEAGRASRPDMTGRARPPLATPPSG